ncbi:hypothetical protein [Ruegeria sp. Ofav3-42]|uniref:hypothetical protein n=1 Tax=Ruegeria sp. Ofav3-42 TaxID=2917759 RepID=UPI001EF5355F|nr:hypothetical protein [Ruegeria sp. Ofav3-42]MCG7520870.1 hypothetical protein [Ruegeria sp. Ofav3-42]
MKLRVFHNIPIFDAFRKRALSGIDLIRVPRLASTQHQDCKVGGFGVPQNHSLFAQDRWGKADRKATTSVFLLNHPSPMSVFVLNVVRKPIHAATLFSNTLVLNRLLRIASLKSEAA